MTSPAGNATSNVAVIGGGWAGLAAAVTLAEHHHPVTVFEASRSLGGRARRVEIEGRMLDNGQHILIGGYTESQRLMRLVGLDPAAQLIRSPMALSVHPGFTLRARRLPGHLGLAAGLLGAQGITFSERLSAVGFMRRVRNAGFKLPHDQSVRRLLEEHEQSRDICRFLWHPLCIAALNTPPAQASARVFLSVLRDTVGVGGGAADLLLPRIDLSALFPEPAARYIEQRGGRVELARSIRRITRTSTGWQVNDGVERYGAVIVACAPQHAVPLLAPFAELAAERAALQSFEYEPILTCYLEYPEDFRLPQPMLGVAEGMVQWLFDRGQLGGPAGLIAAVTSASRDDGRLPELALRAAKEIAAIFPEAPSPRWMRVIAERRATFACTPDLRRPTNRTLVGGLYLAGDYTASDYPATLESAVRSGITAGQLVRDATHKAAHSAETPQQLRPAA